MSRSTLRRNSSSHVASKFPCHRAANSLPRRSASAVLASGAGSPLPLAFCNAVDGLLDDSLPRIQHSTMQTVCKNTYSRRSSERGCLGESTCF
jgi:hypothetical protein